MSGLLGDGRDGGLTVALRVTPKGGRAAVEGPVEMPSGRRLKVRVTAPAEDGKANAAVIALLAKTWRVPKSALAVTGGVSHRDKIVTVTDGASAVRQWFSERGWA